MIGFEYVAYHGTKCLPFCARSSLQLRTMRHVRICKNFHPPLANHGDYVRSYGRFVFITGSKRVLLYEHASDHAEATISCMVGADVVSTTND
jgi:hypothetical protein